MTITGKTKLFGLFGHPVEHSFSPGMHNAAFAALGIDACYAAFPVPPGGLAAATRAIPALGLGGVNVTVPHKERVIPFLDDLSEEARLIGAVNTIEVREGRLIGHNTDGRGFVRSLVLDARVRPAKKSFLIIGAGGAGRAIGFSLALEGAAAIAYYDTDAEKAERLAGDIRQGTGLSVQSVSAAGLEETARSCHCLINATPLGMKEGDPLPVPREAISRKQVVYDIVYNPSRTGLLKAAGSRGARPVPGIGMLLYQGVIAFEIWTGRRAPVEVMKRALLRQMASRKR